MCRARLDPWHLWEKVKGGREVSGRGRATLEAELAAHKVCLADLGLNDWRGGVEGGFGRFGVGDDCRRQSDQGSDPEPGRAAWLTQSSRTAHLV